MGYTHYYYVAPEFDAKAFGRVAADFKKLAAPLKHLGVVLADGGGENHPTVSPTEIVFNGLEACGHEKRDLGITWPAAKATGIAKNGVDQQLNEITKSTWFAGATLETRACGGDCSHETFALEQKLETTMKRYDGTTYELEAQEEFCSWRNQDGTRKKNPVNEIGKYFQCTKTAFKPYDLAVTAALVIAKRHLGDAIIIHSDGDMENWHEAMQLCHHFLGYGRGFCLDDGESDPLDPADPHAMMAACRKDQQEIKTLKAEQERLSTEKTAEIDELDTRYNKTISELEAQRWIVKDKLRGEISAAKETADGAVDKLDKSKEHLDRTINFLRVEQKTLDSGPLDGIKGRRNARCKAVETYKDDCMELRLFITENDKPKNKYSVIVAGVSKLGSDERNDGILHLPYGYGAAIWAQGLDVIYGAKDVPTIEAAKKYAKTRGIKKILKAFFEKYDAVHQEYEEACKKYSLDDFGEIINERFVAYWDDAGGWAKGNVISDLGMDTDKLDEMSAEETKLVMKATEGRY